MNGVLLDVKKTGQDFHLAVGLLHRILKRVIVSVNALRPHFLMGKSENPSLFVFCLDDKESKLRHDEVIDLRSSAGRWNDDVMKSSVSLLIEKNPHFECGLLLTEPAFQSTHKRDV